MSKKDPLLDMLEQRGLTKEQIGFLVEVLNQIREQKGGGKVNADAAVRIVLEKNVSMR